MNSPSPAHTRGPWRYLLWLVTSQPWRTAAGATLGTLWMVSLAIPPYLLSRAIDDGLRARDHRALVGWVAVLLGVGLATAGLGVARHRTMTKIRMDALFRTIRTTVRHATHLGDTLPRRVGTGEIVAIGMSDAQTIASALTVTGPGVGAVVAYVVVATLMLSISPLLAVVVLAGVPLLAVTVGPLLHRLLGVDGAYREQQGALTGRLVDVLDGLRVLNGLGGKRAQANRFRRESRALRDGGYRVGAVTSWVGALAAGLPTLFLAVVIWLAARMSALGEISIGDLVAVYGYVAVLVVPVAFFIEGGQDLIRARVAAARVTRFLRLERDQVDARTVVAAPADGVLHDPVSGVQVRPGLLTVLAGAQPEVGAAILDRLGRFADSAATWDGLRLDTIGLGQFRDRILVADNDAHLFAGSVRQVVAGRGEPADAGILAAIHAAAATDVVEALPLGLDSTIEAGGRNLSGGQRQRLRLARAIYAGTDVLLAAEPTSAVDAHTEAAMAARLRAVRRGRTTVVTSTSPLVLDQADVVVHLVDGRVAGTGTHQDLLRAEPDYRALVARDADAEPAR